jgi:3-isopropylmalate/(R)-2-methylmalate dehydratase small subunit
MSRRSAEQIRERRGQAIALRGNDIDTDQIIPARYMTSVRFAGLEEHVFQDQRFDAHGKAKGHAFDREEFRNASILVVNRNFGCGSSREHAPQALQRWGIRAIIGESFAEIFFGNCVALGIPAAVASGEDIGRLMDAVELDPGQQVGLDLAASTVAWRGGSAPAVIPDGPRRQLMEGTWDAMATLLAAREQVIATEGRLPYPRFAGGDR